MSFLITKSNLRIIANNLFKTDHTPTGIDLEAHLHTTVRWLLRAQAVGKDGGIPACYKIVPTRWAYSYPETTGYTIPTLIKYAKNYQAGNVFTAVNRMAEYELSVQFPDGSFPGLSEKPQVQ